MKIGSKEPENRQKLDLWTVSKDPRIAWLFAMFIGELGNAAEYCCKDGSIWVSCATPLLERLEKWRFCGIPADPYFDN